jgi:hypothetical protein
MQHARPSWMGDNVLLLASEPDHASHATTGIHISPFQHSSAILKSFHPHIGAAPLFSSLRFRASKHSLTRMRKIISSSPPTSLMRYVKEVNLAKTMYACEFEGMSGFELDTNAEELVDYSIFGLQAGEERAKRERR